MTITAIITFVLFFYLIERVYFKIAKHYRIIDKPNERSSHERVTIRGGGIIFIFGLLTWFVLNDFKLPYFVSGLVILAVISIMDDMVDLNRRLRVFVHLIGVLFIFWQWGLFDMPWFILIGIAVFIIATINAYNFMDGINGMLGGYSSITLISLFYINKQIEFADENLLIIIGLCLMVFNYYNFRKRAQCFAGDVGSVGMAFILVFLIGELILKTGNLSYVLLLLVYGLDTSFTVLFRVIRKENIFDAHRSHFYQYLTNQLKWPHISVALLYGIMQLLLNILLIFLIARGPVYVWIFVGVASLIFFALRLKIEGKNALFKGNSAQ